MIKAIEPLGKHDRAAFSCGVVALDEWFRFRAGQDEKRNVARVFVAIDDLRRRHANAVSPGLEAPCSHFDLRSLRSWMVLFYLRIVFRAPLVGGSVPRVIGGVPLPPKL
jgi:hypothetical protein